MTSSYMEKEISEWNSTDLYNWLIDNKYRGISELCQKYSLSGYDLFFITDEILKDELGLSSFHERTVTLKLIKKLTSEHLKLNIINSNGDNVILTLDNNHNTSLGELSNYIGNMFDINPNLILYKDNTRQEVLSPTLKIVQLMILYPKIYKTLNISNMKDYHQIEEKMGNNENNEDANSMSKTGDTISHNMDNFKNNNENEKDQKIKNKKDLPLINTMYSFGDNSGDLNSGSISNNFNFNNNNINNNNSNKYYNEVSPINYKIPPEMSNLNRNNNIMLKNNNSLNINQSNEQNNMLNNITPSNIGNRKYKSEKRIYREKEDFYFNNNQIQNNASDYIQNNEALESSSSNEDNEPIQYNHRNYQNNNEDINNNNYDMRKIDIQNNKYMKYQRDNDNSDNYFHKDDYDNENENRRIKIKRGFDNELYKGKMYKDNFNDSNQI